MKKHSSATTMAKMLVDDICVVSFFLHLISKNETIDPELLQKCVQANDRCRTLLGECLTPGQQSNSLLH